MTVILNGVPLDLSGSFTLEELLIAQEYKGKIFAVAVNAHFIPQKLYPNHVLKNGDSIEIVAPMQGG